MLAIGRAIAAGPCVLLVDEPSLGLAPLVVDSVLENLRRYATATGAGVVLVEQHTDLALAIADRGYVFANGSVIAQGLAADLRADATGLAASYLGGR